MSAASTIPEVHKSRRLPPGVRARAARRHRLETARRLLPLRRAGMALDQAAEELNRQGWPTFSGGPWTRSRLSSVARLARVDAISARPPVVLPCRRGEEAAPGTDERIARAAEDA